MHNAAVNRRGTSCAQFVPLSLAAWRVGFAVGGFAGGAGSATHAHELPTHVHVHAHAQPHALGAEASGSLAWLCGGVVLSRAGLWVFDLSVSQLFQQSVPPAQRGAVGAALETHNALLEVRCGRWGGETDKTLLKVRCGRRGGEKEGLLEEPDWVRTRICARACIMV